MMTGYILKMLTFQIGILNLGIKKNSGFMIENNQNFNEYGLTGCITFIIQALII